MSNVGADRNVALAQAIARWAHTGQYDKNGYDYIEHPAAVAAYVRADDPHDYDGQIVAWLHDTFEDTPITYGSLIPFFPVYVLNAVKLLSRNLSATGDQYYVDIRHDPLALRVKQKDITHNTSAKRMTKLDETTRTRLIKKYAHALEILNA